MNQQEIHDLLAGLPAAGRIHEGLRDHRENRHTIPACLVRMARPRLARADLMSPSPSHDTCAELDLYQLLSSEGQRAHSCYNALVRELISFEHALDHRLRQPPSSTNVEH
jgi:hypothetical protein